MSELQIKENQVQSAENESGETQVIESTSAEEKKVEGLGGWLIVLIVLLFISAARVAFQLFSYSQEINPGLWSDLTTKGSEFYDPFLAKIIVLEIGGNLAILIFSIFLIVWFFKKKKSFPRFYILLLILNAVLVTMDQSLMMKIPESGIASDAVTKTLVNSAVKLFVWISYFTKSERVNNTFIN